jgi:DNA topoisomerase I
MSLDQTSETGAIVDPEAAAESAGLVYVSDAEPGVRRQRHGKSFAYKGRNGEAITDKRMLERIYRLAIPPAWTDVWISISPNGHIQATGRDARGRKQYKYHARWREVRDSTKFEHMVEFASALPRIRKRMAADLGARGLSRRKVLATVVYLLENTLIRVGNSDYAKQNKSFGLTTLRDGHVDIDGSELRFEFNGKSGKTWKLRMRDRRIASVVKSCQDLPGQHLFQYVDENGERQQVSSTDVNDYLREIAGGEVTAKDFRTWAGTVLAAMALSEFESFDSEAGAKRNIKLAIEKVAARLGNTPTICRQCYIHPEVLNAYLEGSVLTALKQEAESELKRKLGKLSPEEAAVLSLIQSRLKREVAAKRKKAA